VGRKENRWYRDKLLSVNDFSKEIESLNTNSSAVPWIKVYHNKKELSVNKENSLNDKNLNALCQLFY
jgi:hypothetical protein